MPNEFENKVPLVEPDTKASAVAEVKDSETNVIESEQSVMDELTSIERDLAIMHDADEDEHEQPNVLQSGIVEEVLAMGIASSSNDPLSDNKNIASSSKQNDETNEKPLTDKTVECRNGTSKTLETTNDAPDSTTGTAAVIIEKTDEAPLLHDDLIAVLKGIDTEDSVEQGVTIEGEGEFQIVDVIDSEMESVDSNPQTKEKKKPVPLTKEQERKLALEQFQAITRPPGKAREVNRRRKQDIKSVREPADLVTSLVSDWSDGDEANANASEDDAPPPIKKKVAVKATQSAKSAAPTLKPVALTLQATKAAPVSKTTAKAPQKLVQKSEVPADKDKDKIKEKEEATAVSKKVTNPTQPKKLVTVEKKQPDPPPQPTFKRTRIIKRKIIWDPDAPETQFSYAQLVKPSTPVPAKKEKPATQKPKNGSEDGSRAGTPPVKRASSATPSVNGGNRKKNSREIDRLLGDEGAVNMLNSLETERSKRTPDTESVSPRVAAARKTAAAASPSSVEKAPATASKKETPMTAKTNRKTKPKAPSSWDYVYKRKKEQDDDAMIIRRRSNSSYSSSASINRLSVDGPGSSGKTVKSTPTTPSEEQQNPPTTPPDAAENQFEFAKPENKNKQKNTKSPIVVMNALTVDLKRGTAKRTVKSSTVVDDAEDSDEEKTEKGDVKVLTMGNVSQITFSTHRAKLDNTFTVPMMNELSRVLERLDKDASCNAVLMLSKGSDFCQGIDFSSLVVGTAEKRKAAAVQMAKAVRNFLTTLAQFSKPLIAGVNGSNSGLGVTMLPLFDVVIGSDKGSYETPYAKIGQIPEGYFIFSETSKIRSTFKTKLLWLSEKLHSTESALSGLVNKLTSVTKVNKEALAAAKRIASLSSETYSVMKRRSIENILPQILDALEDEEEILIRQWCSASCVQSFNNFIENGQW